MLEAVAIGCIQAGTGIQCLQRCSHTYLKQSKAQPPADLLRWQPATQPPWFAPHLLSGPQLTPPHLGIGHALPQPCWWTPPPARSPARLQPAGPVLPACGIGTECFPITKHNMECWITQASLYTCYASFQQCPGLSPTHLFYTFPGSMSATQLQL